MKLDTLLSVLKRSPQDEAGNTNTEVRSASPIRLVTPAEPRPRPAEAPSPGDPVDTVKISVQATYVLAASQFDPRAITAPETTRLADQLYEGGAISSRDRNIIADGPREVVGALPRDGSAGRDLLSDFQAQLAEDVGRSDLRSIDDSTRAVTILGRVASIREAIA
jgi:hypothetical protein